MVEPPFSSMEKEEFSVKFAENEDIVSEKYIYKDGCYYQRVDNSVTYMEPLLIDYSLLISSSSSQKERDELEKFKSALCSYGCFQLINHGIQISLLDEIKKISRQFFALPKEEKQKYAMLPKDTNGYQRGVVTNSTPTNQVLDWNEGINLTLFPEDRRQLKFWPENSLHFK
ncbi:S-norcoclaurine synthase 1-like [Beta vulgaris subsp. vulgaris]|uniref:S-norcoclaurine synthase 1-like n=1 Tax=Beta vulgaris subsp. vulgaris TaxID=3555 RepID=UPI002548C309|nr:S-norcoclaurine synthase 1-like [Beta vulgaris subsp. vulgaris]